MTATLKVDLTAFGKPVKFELGYDSMFTQERTLALCLQQLGTCEPELTHAMLRVIKPGDVVADVGAAVGFFTVLMAKLVGPSGLVYSFEPDARNYDRLRHNIELNGLQNVRVIEWPVSSEAGKTVPFHIAKDSGDNSLGDVQVLHQLTEKMTTSLDSFPELSTASFVKVDVEGAEHLVMRGADSLLVSRVPFISLEMNEKALQKLNTSRQLLREHMAGYGYDGWLMQTNGQLPWFVPLQTKLTGGPANLNMLFAEERTVAAHWGELKI